MDTESSRQCTSSFHAVTRRDLYSDERVAPNVTVGSDTTYTFTITFSDNLAIDSASLGAGDIHVTGPGDFNQLATLISVTL